MEGFDAPGVFYSEAFQAEPGQLNNESSNLVVKKRFKAFLREFCYESNFKYRNELKCNYAKHNFWLEIICEDLSAFDAALADKFFKKPTEMLVIFEEGATEVADEVTAPRPLGEEGVEPIQLIFHSEAIPTSMRKLNANIVSQLVKISGIVVSASGIKSKATKISLQCRSCRHIIPNLTMKPGLDGYQMPLKCTNAEQQQGGGGKGKCPLDPFFIVPTKCTCVDFQILKIQESPDSVPHGEMPRHLTVFVDRALCDRVVPGNRITLIGVYSIRKAGSKNQAKKQGAGGASVGVRIPYVRAVGVHVATAGMGRTAKDVRYTPNEEETFRRLAERGDIHELISKSIAPSIFGSADIKKALACMLFGGSRKILPDGLTRRGDVNILLLGDPGTAKSQLLKFVERVAPIAVYTSGKGSSAAGLTASVMKDPTTRSFVVEGGAMVLADGGVVCIDEFDKMREDDRVAIHEAMEQQTISIAKAGITTTLNTRCSVLAAANSVFGRWDDSKSDDDNIDFMPTILSRFDCIFIIKDEHNANRDLILAKHVIGVHMNASSTLQLANNGNVEDEQSEMEETEVIQKDGCISASLLKKFIGYARSSCGPRLSEQAGEKLKNQYIVMRSESKNLDGGGGGEVQQKRSAIPITVRQLEAIIRMAESLAKMQLQPFVSDKNVEESLRIFKVSTMSAASSGALSGVQGFTSEQDREMLNQIERQIKRRFAVGSQVSSNAIVQDFTRQKFAEGAVHKVILTMIRRGELQHRLQRKMIFRLK